MRGSLRSLIATFAAALCCLAALAPSASAQDPGPPYTDWNPRQIGFPSNAEPNRLRSLLGPGVAVVRQRSLRVG